MASCTIFTALITVGPHITLMLPAILSDPEPGMLRDGWRGIGDSLNTGRVFSASILIGVDTGRVSVIAGNFLSNTMLARAVGGRKGSKAAPLPHPALKDANRVRLKRRPLKGGSLLCSANMSSTSSLKGNSTVTLKRNKNGKGTSNNSKGWNPVPQIMDSQRGVSANGSVSAAERLYYAKDFQKRRHRTDTG